jgi:GH35 family endo-1,4-beta-xylanase
VGSLTGAVASQKVTEAFTKVGLAPMETELDVQTHKPALLQDLQVEQSRKRKLVIRPFAIGRRKLIGQKLLWG